VGDGCERCNPQLAIQLLKEQVADMRLTDAEREAIKRAIDSQQRIAAELHSRSWNAAAIDDDCDTLRGILGRLG
jgi:hypothetical protein